MPAKIKLYQTDTGDYRFDLVAENRAVMGSSGLFSTRDQARLAIDLIRMLAKDPRQFGLYCDADGKYCFRLNSRGGEAVLESQGYSSNSAAQEGLRLLQDIAVNAPITEVT